MMANKIVNFTNGGYLVLEPHDNLKSFEHQLIAKILSDEYGKTDITRIVSEQVTCHSKKTVEAIASDIRSITKRYYETPMIRLFGNSGISNLIFLDDHLKDFITNAKENKISDKIYPSFRLINKDDKRLNQLHESLYDYGFINDGLRKFKSIFKGKKINESNKLSWQKSFPALKLFVSLIHSPVIKLCEHSNVAHQETAINCISKKGKNIKINQINRSGQPSKPDSHKIYKVIESLSKES